MCSDLEFGIMGLWAVKKTKPEENKHENQTLSGFGLPKAFTISGQILRRQEKLDKRGRWRSQHDVRGRYVTGRARRMA